MLLKSESLITKFCISMRRLKEYDKKGLG